MAFIMFALIVTIWDSNRRVVYGGEKRLVEFCAKMVFYDYYEKGSLPSKTDDIERWDDGERGRLIYRVIDAKSNIFSISSKKIKDITMLFKINGTTNDPTLNKIEGDNLIQIDDFSFIKEGSEKEKLEEDSKME
ncbi:MAG: hypothetical protein EOM12_13005 [Verrucomicrobiae bacterium]|nr:hypothetical protein [Verrucomicrobiae bacterium]